MMIKNISRTVCTLLCHL